MKIKYVGINIKLLKKIKMKKKFCRRKMQFDLLDCTRSYIEAEPNDINIPILE